MLQLHLIIDFVCMFVPEMFLMINFDRVVFLVIVYYVLIMMLTVQSELQCHDSFVTQIDISSHKQIIIKSQVVKL